MFTGTRPGEIKPTFRLCLSVDYILTEGTIYFIGYFQQNDRFVRNSHWRITAQWRRLSKKICVDIGRNNGLIAISQGKRMISILKMGMKTTLNLPLNLPVMC